jgi:hypothetical protein
MDALVHKQLTVLGVGQDRVQKAGGENTQITR